MSASPLPPPLVLVVILEVRRDQAAVYREFETAAAAIMADHGGCVERVIAVADSDPPAAHSCQVHVVTFPGAVAFESYRRDPRLAKLAPIRERVIVSTRILFGHDSAGF